MKIINSMDLNCISSIVTIISFILFVLNTLIIVSYKKRCENCYNIPSRFFNVDVISNFSITALFVVMSIGLVLVKRLEGIQYLFLESICYYLITLLFLISIDEYKFCYAPYLIFGLGLCILKIICLDSEVMANILFLVLWGYLVIRKLFLTDPKKEYKYKIEFRKHNNKLKVVLSMFNNSFLIIDGKIDSNENLILYTDNYRFISSIDYRLSRIEGYKKVIIEKKENNCFCKLIYKIKKK